MCTKACVIGAGGADGGARASADIAVDQSKEHAGIMRSPGEQHPGSETTTRQIQIHSAPPAGTLSSEDCEASTVP